MFESPAQRLGLTSQKSESSILASMRDNEQIAMSVVPELSVDDFDDPRNKIVFHAMSYILAGVESFDLENIERQCRASSAEIFPKLKQRPSVDSRYISALTGNLQDLAKEVSTLKRLSKLRRAADFAYWFVQGVQTSGDPDVFYNEAINRLSSIAPRSKKSNMMYGWDTVKFTDEAVKVRGEETRNGVAKVFRWPKKWATWEKFVRYMRPGLVGLLGAADGVGKSSYLEEIAESWALQGHKVVLVHLEDDHQYKLDRRLARHSGVPLDVIESGVFTEEQQMMISDAEEQISRFASNLHYLHMPDSSMNDIVRELKVYIAEGECDAVVLDYIDKCAPDEKQSRFYSGNPYGREGDDMRKFKAFCENKEHPVVGFSATQGNKEMQDPTKTKTRRDIGGSAQKVYQAQLVLIITRDLVGKGGIKFGDDVVAKEGDYSPFVRVRIDKQNRGMTGEYFQLLDGPRFRIKDMPIGFNPKFLEAQ